jgi:hypothetical protein
MNDYNWLLYAGVGLIVAGAVFMDGARRDRIEREAAEDATDAKLRRDAMQEKWDALRLQMGRKHITTRKNYQPAVNHLAPERRGNVTELRRKRA